MKQEVIFCLPAQVFYSAPFVKNHLKGFIQCADLRDFAYEIAKEEGVSIRPNAEVTSIDTETTSVNLVSGERLSADVIIGADGASGISRSTLLGSRPDKARSMGLIVYEYVSCFL